jgi:hypothetical protein
MLSGFQNSPTLSGHNTLTFARRRELHANSNMLQAQGLVLNNPHQATAGQLVFRLPFSCPPKC